MPTTHIHLFKNCSEHGRFNTARYMIRILYWDLLYGFTQPKKSMKAMRSEHSFHRHPYYLYYLYYLSILIYWRAPCEVVLKKLSKLSSLHHFFYPKRWWTEEQDFKWHQEYFVVQQSFRKDKFLLTCLLKVYPPTIFIYLHTIFYLKGLTRIVHFTLIFPGTNCHCFLTLFISYIKFLPIVQGSRDDLVLWMVDKFKQTI